MMSLHALLEKTPDADVLREMIGFAAKTLMLARETWLETSLSKSYSNAFKDWCKEARLPRCNCHGLRKIGAVRAAEAGASEHELMAMFS